MNNKEKLTEATILALQGKLTERDLSKDLYGNKSNKRMELKRRKYEKDLDNCKRIMRGETVIDPKYGDELDLDTAKKLLRDDYIYLNNLSSFTPEEIDEKITKDISDIFGTEVVENNKLNESINSEEQKDTVTSNYYDILELLDAMPDSPFDQEEGDIIRDIMNTYSNKTSEEIAEIYNNYCKTGNY